MSDPSNRNRNLIIGAGALVLVLVLYALFSGGGDAPVAPPGEVAPATEQGG